MIKSKTLKATISGSFKVGKDHIESYEGVTGLLPVLDDEKARQMIIRRFARIWLTQAKKEGTDQLKYPRFQRVREVFVDSIEENDEAPNAVLSYVGKNIMDMNFEELQDLAAAKDLSRVPLYRHGSVVNARRIAWSEYATKVMGAVGEEYDYRNQAFNPSKHEPIIADGTIRRDNTHVADIEETIDRENLAMQGKAKPVATDSTNSKLNLLQLKAIADSKGIGYHVSIGYDALYKKVYGKAA